jgi:acetyl esterase/lipase
MNPVLIRTVAFRLAALALLLAFAALKGGMPWGNGAEPQPESESAGPDDPARRPDVRVVANERFSDGEGKAGLCDVYCPKSTASQAGHPAVIVVHGGGWISGDKWTLEGYSRSLAEHGFVAVTINYRLAPTHKFPAQVDDVRSALLWAKRNADRFGIDINRLGIFGYSAGGHLSALVASLADESLQVRAAASQWDESDQRWNELPAIRAVCAGGPPCDFRSLSMDNATLAYFLGGSRREKPEIYVAASPAAHVSPGDPVTQLIHGESDLLVPISESRQFHELQRAAGIDSRFEIMPNQGHMITFLNPKTNRKMLDFFQEVLVNPSASAATK